ncbi:DivIVA domain-containing protein [Micromonospora zhanjiangensis]|uniref:Cell wall synthesis protein Wag31 n=1 Tax=Micromonospora zhanjiangensis TaxID=1522057 RepID=A0ABV8KEU8_9ACTN
MRRFLRRLWPRSAPRHAAGPRPETRRPNAGTYYRSTARPALSERQIRTQRFARAWRGLDPAEVDLFLHRVAAELAAVRNELAWTRDENTRIKNAMRDWRSQFPPPLRPW